MKSVLVSVIPECNFCDELAHCDAPMKGRGSWAYMCLHHFTEMGQQESCGTVFVLDERTEDDTKYDVTKELNHANNLTENQLGAMVIGAGCEAADGCSVEPDGKCQHGYSSPLKVLGIM